MLYLLLLVGLPVLAFFVPRLVRYLQKKVGWKWLADEDPYDNEEEYDITSERLDTKDFKTLKHVK